ncbi:hypothetical protein LQG66_31920 [Bradyrhizobium ontarionense]|uniref:Uncharacterized protein n=1 Tax=Bradyrhizobium ontarionense TaxID=2898149 RepID=A0ABY3R992_9BRAD|nr:hypothetical protein [Bradyrhizobium sp. A19]UFZ03763.1 hypothetical protein LQG66_31920 [Bradyrhizobium sp. A19]
MTLISIHRDPARGFGRGVALLPRTLRRVRTALRTIHAAIAAAKIRRLRRELMLRGGYVGAPSIAPDPARPRMSPIKGNKWDF